MTAKEIKEVLNARKIAIVDEEKMDKNYPHAFASDLMSDVLAMVQKDSDKTVLITGLCNAQAIRTAEMLDMDFIVFARGKRLADDVVDLAEEAGINVVGTSLSMYEACGRLFAEGLSAIDV
ncbi:MAG: hypothetical protein J5928_01200 [Firmicutes bacterium]|nr:hypothetical protein [Bacillota bacterium]